MMKPLVEMYAMMDPCYCYWMLLMVDDEALSGI
jgi:hypothetical protein